MERKRMGRGGEWYEDRGPGRARVRRTREFGVAAGGTGLVESMQRTFSGGGKVGRIGPPTQGPR